MLFKPMFIFVVACVQISKHFNPNLMLLSIGFTHVFQVHKRMALLSSHNICFG